MVNSLDKNLTVREIILRVEELGREFSAVSGDLQRGFDILRDFLELNLQWELLKRLGLTTDNQL